MSGISVDELATTSTVSGTFDLLTTVRTVVAVAVEPPLDEDESSGAAAHLHRPRSAAQSFHVFTVDAATMSANVSIADADVGLSGSDWTTSNSLCAFMTPSGVPFSCRYSCIQKSR